MGLRRDSPIRRWRWERPSQHHVLLWWSDPSGRDEVWNFDLHTRGAVLSSAIEIDANSNSYFAHFERNDYLVFCFNSREAAEQFRDQWDGQFIDADEVDQKGIWRPTPCARIWPN